MAQILLLLATRVAGFISIFSVLIFNAIISIAIICTLLHSLAEGNAVHALVSSHVEVVRVLLQ